MGLQINSFDHAVFRPIQFLLSLAGLSIEDAKGIWFV